MEDGKGLTRGREGAEMGRREVGEVAPIGVNAGGRRDGRWGRSHAGARRRGDGGFSLGECVKRGGAEAQSLQRCRDAEMQRCRVAELQSCRDGRRKTDRSHAGGAKARRWGNAETGFTRGDAEMEDGKGLTRGREGAEMGRREVGEVLPI